MPIRVKESDTFAFAMFDGKTTHKQYYRYGLCILTNVQLLKKQGHIVDFCYSIPFKVDANNTICRLFEILHEVLPLEDCTHHILNTGLVLRDYFHDEMMSSIEGKCDALVKQISAISTSLDNMSKQAALTVRLFR